MAQPKDNASVNPLNVSVDNLVVVNPVVPVDADPPNVKITKINKKDNKKQHVQKNDNPDKNDKNNNNKQGLCPFYGSSAGCPYLTNCKFSHTNPDSIGICMNYQTLNGCSSSSSCLYRHSLPPLTPIELKKLTDKYNISGKIQYTRSIKGKSVHRAIIIINQILWYGIHLIIEDTRLQKIHYQKYSSIYHWDDSILVAELLSDIILKSQSPGKYISYFKNIIDGNSNNNKDKDKDNNCHSNDVHFRDILYSIGNNYNELPKPINPHLVKNLNRVPWIDFKIQSLPPEAYEFPDIYLKPGDLVRIYRPKKFVYHCGVYLGDKKVIHVSNGVKGDGGMRWTSILQSGSPASKKYYDYGKKVRNTDKKHDKGTSDDMDMDMDIVAVPNDINPGKEGIGGKGNKDDNHDDVYDDDDDMDLVNDSDDDIVDIDNNEDEKIGIEPNEGNITINNNDNNKVIHGMDAWLNNNIQLDSPSTVKAKRKLNKYEMENERRARECDWNEFLIGSRPKDLELGFFILPWRTSDEIIYTARFLTEIHYMKGQYSVFNNNCEHFALYCCTGLRYSPQSHWIENVQDVASKIGSFAGKLFNKVSWRKSNKKKKNTKSVAVDQKETENHKNHPVIQSNLANIDDGGDDELEKMLQNSSGNLVDKNNKKILKKPVKHRLVDKNQDDFDIVPMVIDDDDDKNDKNQNNVIIDEYGDDDIDVLAESIIIEQNMDIIDDMKNLSDMTPGGLSNSDYIIAKKHPKNNAKWNV